MRRRALYLEEEEEGGRRKEEEEEEKEEGFPNTALSLHRRTLPHFTTTLYYNTYTLYYNTYTISYYNLLFYFLIHLSLGTGAHYQTSLYYNTYTISHRNLLPYFLIQLSLSLLRRTRASTRWCCPSTRARQCSSPNYKPRSDTLTTDFSSRERDPESFLLSLSLSLYTHTRTHTYVCNIYA